MRNRNSRSAHTHCRWSNFCCEVLRFGAARTSEALPATLCVDLHEAGRQAVDALLTALPKR
jgi:hypothetical protein